MYLLRANIKFNSNQGKKIDKKINAAIFLNAQDAYNSIQKFKNNFRTHFKVIKNASKIEPAFKWLSIIPRHKQIIIKKRPFRLA